MKEPPYKSNTIPFCVNCKNHAFVDHKHCCLHPNLSTYIDAVTGETVYGWAHSIRAEIDKCGPNGAWFEPIE